jgi:hypothetical protein
MNEDQIVGIAQAAIEAALAPPLLVKRGAALLYQMTVDNHLNLRVDPKRPMRGQSAFQIDLCVFESVEEEVLLPRVVLEFKAGMSTHDILTYSAKARKHKQIYPYLRYGLVVGRDATVASKFFIHNEALDFCLAASTYLADGALGPVLSNLIIDEIKSSRLLEGAAFERRQWQLFRTQVVVQPS